MFGNTSGKKLILFSVLLLTLMLGVGIGTIITYRASANGEDRGERLKIQGEGSPLTLGKKVDLLEGFSAVAEAVEPAVVNISVQTRVQLRKMHEQTGPLGDEFWKRFFGQEGGPDSPRDYVQRSLGSGVLVDSKGFILTNNHVIDGADSISVKLADGREFDGKVVGADSETDVAIVRINGDKPFPFAYLGDADKLKVGDWVIAIGSPFGLEQTVTAGIVSAKGRVFLTQSLFGSYIQTDAAINPGNSGGPMVNMRGEVVGLNNFIESRSGGNIGIGFAIPTDVIVNVYNQIIETGRVSRGYLGVSMNTLPMTEAMRKYFQLKGRNGVIVTEFGDGDSPAKEAGLLPDDVIVELNGKPVDGPDMLRKMVANVPPGSKIAVKVVRKGQEKDFSIALKERPDLRAEASGSKPVDLDREEQRQKPEIGLTVDDLTPQMAGQVDLKPYTGGALVADVKSGSLAEDAGLIPNDLIVLADGDAVTSSQVFVSKIRGLSSGESVVLKFLRFDQRGRKMTFYTSLTKP